MKLYRCDICGKIFDPTQIGCHRSDAPLGVPGVFGVAVSGLDICGNCMRVGREVDFQDEMKSAWKAAVRLDKEEE